MPGNDHSDINAVQESIDDLGAVLEKLSSWFNKSADKARRKEMSSPAPATGQPREYIAGPNGQLTPVETVDTPGGGAPTLQQPTKKTPNGGSGSSWGQKLVRSNLTSQAYQRSTVAGVNIPAHISSGTPSILAGALTMYGAASSAGQQAMPSQFALSNLSQQAGLLGMNQGQLRSQAVGYGNGFVNNAASSTADASAGTGITAAAAGGFNPLFRTLMGSNYLMAYSSGASLGFAQTAAFSQQMYSPNAQAQMMGILGPNRSALNIGGGQNSATQTQQNILSTVFGGVQSPAKLAQQLKTGGSGQTVLAQMGIAGAPETDQLEAYNEVANKSKMSPAQVQALFTTAERGGSGANSAMQTLSHYGVNETDLQHVQNVGAVKSGRQNELYNPYTAGLADATGALAQFNAALNDFMTNKVVGPVAGYMQGAGAGASTASAGNMMNAAGGVAGAAAGAGQAMGGTSPSSSPQQSAEPSELQTLSSADPSGISGMNPTNDYDSGDQDPGSMGQGGSSQPGTYGGGIKPNHHGTNGPERAAAIAASKKPKAHGKGGGGGSGGYQNPIRGAHLSPERIDQGVDYSGSGPIYSLGAGVVRETENAGWPGGAFIEIELTGGSVSGGFTYYAEYITPKVSIGQHVTSSTVVGEIHGGIEIGWAAGDGGEAMAMKAGQAKLGLAHGDPGTFSTGWGMAFNHMLTSLGGMSGSPVNKPIQGQGDPPLDSKWGGAGAGSGGGGGGNASGGSGTSSSTTTTYAGLGLGGGSYGSEEEIDVISQGLMNMAGQDDFTGITTSTTTTPGSGGGGGSGGTSGDVTAGKSEKAFFTAVLKDLGAPATAANLSSMYDWARHEEPTFPPPFKWNPLNTTESMPGATYGGAEGHIGNYTSPTQGAEATAKTLQNGLYTAIVARLKSGKGLSGTGPWNAELSKWSGGGYSQLASGTYPYDAPKRPSKLVQPNVPQVNITASSPVKIDLHGAQFDPDGVAAELVKELRKRMAAVTA